MSYCNVPVCLHALLVPKMSLYDPYIDYESLGMGLGTSNEVLASERGHALD